MQERPCPVVFRTRGPGFHFFGYYDKSPLDRRSQRLLCHHGRFGTRRMPRADDVVEIGLWSLADGGYRRLAQTRAYNWQQGAQLQWLPPDYERRAVFNDREGDRFVARVVDVEDGGVRTLPFPIYTLHPSGRSAICVNYERLYFPRGGYSYEGVVNERWNAPLPPGDGLFRLDLESGETQLVVRTEDVARLDPVSSMRGAVHYLEHAIMSPDGSRFAFLHRWILPDGGIYGRLFSADEWGRDLRCLHDTGYASHFGWRGGAQISIWARPKSAVADLRRSRFLSRFLVRPLLPLYHRLVPRTSGVRRRLLRDTYLLIDEASGAARPLAPGVAWPDDGHCTWRPGDPRWMLTDTYEDAAWHRHLFLYDHERQELTRIGRFYSLRETCSTGFRTDLHPRFDQAGTRVCIDSTHEGGERQIYVIDVSEVVGRRGDSPT
jgi:hypothetical protein